MFLSRSFIVFGLTFRSLIHFEFIFVYGIRKHSDFIPFSPWHLILPALHCVQSPVMQNLCGSSSLWLLLVGELESPGGRSPGGGGHAVGKWIIELRTQLSISLTPPLTVFPAFPSILVLFLCLLGLGRISLLPSRFYILLKILSWLCSPLKKKSCFASDFFFQKCLDIFPLLFSHFLFGLCWYIVRNKKFLREYNPWESNPTRNLTLVMYPYHGILEFKRMI